MLAFCFIGAFFSANYANGQAGNWIWAGGSKVANFQPGVYGTKGVPAPANLPEQRFEASSATDSKGNFWLFGGGGGASGKNSTIHFNDLWQFSPVTNEWTWWSGRDSTTGGVYGTVGVAAPDSVPGAREAAILWSDQNGNIWLFGGWGYDSAATLGMLNDLWKFDIVKMEWTWERGSSTLPNATDTCAPGVYGTQGVASRGNTPGGRQGAAGWTGSGGSLWLFAGGGCDASGAQGLLNDVWRFDPASGEWTWIAGTNAAYSAGVYGTLGTPSAGSTPGGRWFSSNLGTDSSGNFWLFGGDGLDSTNTRGLMNDLWEFNTTTQQWVWQSGNAVLPPSPASSTPTEPTQPGVYGSLGQYAPGNLPGGRTAGVGSVDSNGKLWLFGGFGEPTGVQDFFNDLWTFDPGSKQWAWMSGSDTPVCLEDYANGSCAFYGAPDSYGTLGVPTASNVPGSRESGVSWMDTRGGLWIFGGSGVDFDGHVLPLNDLWKFQTAAAVATPVFGAMTFSPTSTVTAGISESITIGDTLTYAGVQPTGAVTFVLNGVSYTATCAQAQNPNGSPETCSVQVPAATIAALPVAIYSVAANIAADSSYTASTGASGTFTMAAATSGCTVPAPTSNTMNIAYYTLAEHDRDGSNLGNGVSSNYVLPALGTNGLPVYNTSATANSGAVRAPSDLLADSEITWWSPALNNGGLGGSSDVIETSIGVVPLPFASNAFFPPNGTGQNDFNGFQTAVLTGTLVAPAPETVSFTIASDDMAFLYLDGQIACDDGGVHAPTSVPCTTSTIAAGTHTLKLFYADLNPQGAALNFTVTTSNVGVGAGDQLVFGTMTFSPAATEPRGTSQAITISDAITYSGAQPTGAVSFVLNGVSYTATCTTGGSPETCTAVVPADISAALPAAAYPVTASFAGDCNYATATVPAGTFTIVQQQVTFGTVTFSPVATVLVGTSQAITIGDTLSYPGVPPKGAVNYVLNAVSYPATCTTGGSSETCTAQVPAATIAALPSASYTVAGSFAGDSIYAAATAAPGIFTVTLPPPDFSMAPGPLTIVTQHHGSTTVSVTPINGFSGVVSLSCGTVPKYVTCAWDPADVTVSGGTTATELKIDTSAILNYLAATHPSAPSHGPSRMRFALAGLAFPALLLLRRRRKTAVRLIVCVLVLISALHLSGCSGKYPDSTTPGTYSIPIVGTSGTIQHSAVLTLTVTQ